jgi:uncharacterized protein (DUF924 family)
MDPGACGGCRPEDVLSFWFGSGPEPESRLDLWFGQDPKVDAEIARRFGETLAAAPVGLCDGWARTPRGRLGLVILLDQFSRQVYRGTPRMFAQDGRARSLVEEGIRRGDDGTYAILEAGFFYLPLEHSESLEDQRRSLALFEELHARAPESLEGVTREFLRYARLHLEIIERFGHFPHRNKLLGRSTTGEEATFLQQPDSSF